MSRLIVLDSGPLGLATNPRGSLESDKCNKWLEALLLAGAIVVLPEIADYEVRRELLRADKSKGIKRLDELKGVVTYLPITTDAMLRAAEYWADVRKQGKPTADDKALDGDVILAAQALLFAQPGDDVVIATTNVGHLALFADALEWQEIT